MIYLYLQGGLGNQMFSYAYGRMLQQLTNEKILINTIELEKDTQRDYSLKYLYLNDNVELLKANQKVINKIICKTKLFLVHKVMQHNKGNRSFIEANKKGIYWSLDFLSYYPFQMYRKNKYVIGAIQTSKQVEEVKNVIKEELRVKIEPSTQNKFKIEELETCNSVCVHIRLGDYMHDQWKEKLQVCNEEYYKKGMKHIAEKVENPVFYIFSNTKKDIEWIKNNYKFHYNVKYIELDNPDYEELRLMYSCKHFIISNSSFSWWGAYLSNNEEKIVVCPDRWNNLNMPQEDIYVKEWVKVGN